MKRLITLLFAAALVVGFQTPADAFDVKVGGTWEIGMGWAAHTNFTDADQGEHHDKFGAAQRFRTHIRFVASETLEGVLGFEIGAMTWGDNTDADSGRRMGGGLDADGYEIKVRRAHIDWTPVGDLKLRMGVQLLALPSATFGNPVLDTRVAGVSGNFSFNETVGMSFFWIRPFSDANTSTDRQDKGKNKLDDMDAFGVTLPITTDAFSITPWAMYARNGNESGYWAYRTDDTSHSMFDRGHLDGSSNFWWVGTAIELNVLDPFVLTLDAMYGRAKGGESPEFSGWLVSSLFEYKSGQSWGNPGIFGWYASGDKSDSYKDGENGKYGRMPILSADEAGFAPLAYGFSGSAGCMEDGLLSSSGVGTWGAGLQLAEMSFFDNFSHTVRVGYVRGTNHKDMVRKGGADRLGGEYNIMGEGVYLTTEDYALEFDFLTTWEVSKNFNIHLEANYIKLALDSDVWGSKKSDTTNAWKGQLLFEYHF